MVNFCVGLVPFYTPAAEENGLRVNSSQKCARIIAISIIAMAVFTASLIATFTSSYTYFLLATLTPVAYIAIILLDCANTQKFVANKRSIVTEDCIRKYMYTYAPCKQEINWFREDVHTVEALINECEKDKADLLLQLNKFDGKGNRCLFTTQSNDEVLDLLINTCVAINGKIDFTTRDASGFSFFEELVKDNKQEIINTILAKKWVTIDDVTKLDLKKLNPNQHISLKLQAFVGFSSNPRDLVKNMNKMSRHEMPTGFGSSGFSSGIPEF